jgi:ribosome-associated protein
VAVDSAVIDALGVAAAAAWNKGASNFVALDVTGHLALTDAFLIVSGRSERNTKAIADAIEDELHLTGVKLSRREGKAEGRWILLDFGLIVVHVFHEEEREFYALERLWKDCPVISLTLPGGEQPQAD